MYGESKLPSSEAHALAVQSTEEYALQKLGKDGLKQFNRWSSTLLSQ
jgi:hypothetical protein